MPVGGRPKSMIRVAALNGLPLAIAAAIVATMVSANAIAQSTARPETTLRFGYSTNPTSLDPARSSSGGDRVFLFPVYDRLVRLTNAGEPQPMLATRWEAAEMGTTLRLTLRTGVKFHDGTPFDASAVKANLDRMRNLPESTQKAVLRTISDVQVIDAQRVELKCNGGCGGLIQSLGDTAGMMVSPKAFGNADLGTKPVGAGPFTLVEFRPGARAVYAPAAGYHDPANQRLGGIDISILPDDATRLNALRSGQLDMTFLRPYQVDEAKSAKGAVVPSNGAIWYYLGMNMTRNRFTDIRVRQAMNHAVDKKAISDSLLRGFCTPSDQPIREGVLGFARNTPKIVYDYNPARAKQLLAEAGLPNGFEFEAVVISPPLFVQIAEAIQAQLAQSGIRMKIVPTPIPQAAATYFAKGGADAYFGVNLGQSDPSALMGNLFLKEGFFNPSRFSTEAIQNAHTQSVQRVEAAGRQEAFEAMMKGGFEQAYHVGICDVLTPVAHSGVVRNVNPDVPTWTWDFFGIEVVRR